MKINCGLLLKAGLTEHIKHLKLEVKSKTVKPKTLKPGSQELEHKT